LKDVINIKRFRQVQFRRKKWNIKHTVSLIMVAQLTWCGVSLIVIITLLAIPWNMKEKWKRTDYTLQTVAIARGKSL